MKKFRHTTQKDWTATQCSIKKYYLIKPFNDVVCKELIENSQDWELIPNVEVGKVYKDGNKWLILVKELINSDKCRAIGFGTNGKWFELTEFDLNGRELEATKDEWFERCAEEAIKRGLVDGSKFNCAKGRFDAKVNSYRINNKLSLIDGYSGILMNSDTGEWATLIEEKKPNYTITSLKKKGSEIIYRLQFGGSYRANDNSNGYSLETLMNSGNVEIYSVKNSKEEEFTIGDIIKTKHVNPAPLNKIELYSNDIHLSNKNCSALMEAFIKVKIEEKKPILTTHDGVELFEGDYAYSIDTNYKNEPLGTYTAFKAVQSLEGILFSTPEKAQEYIDNNQKRYSLEDVRSAFAKERYSPWTFNPIINELKKQTK